MEVPSVVIVLVLGFVAACCLADIQTRRIPNLLSIPAIVAGLLLNWLWLGLPGIAHSARGILLVVAVLIGPFGFGGIGGGDVKMMAAVGALLGPHLALASLGMGMALGGIMMVIHLVRLGRFWEKLGATARMILTAAATLSLAPLKASSIPASSAITLPYSVPLGLGTIAAIGLAFRG